MTLREGHLSVVAIAAMRGRLRACFFRFLLVVVVALHGANAACAQESSAAESQVKAAFLYKFCLYVEWPPTAFADQASPLEIGVAGSPEVAAELDKVVAGRLIDTHPVRVRQIKDKSDLAALHVLFIANAEQARIGQWLVPSPKSALLIVTEVPDGLDNGGIINFTLQGNRVRFDIGLASAERQGLRLSAQLLKVARTVYEEPLP